MNNDRQFIEKYIIKFLRQKNVKDSLDIIVKIIFYLFLFSIILIFLSLSGIVYWWTGLVLLFFPIVIVSAYNLFKPVKIHNYILDLDEDLSGDQSLPALYELIISEKFDHMYYRILKERILKMFKVIKPGKIYSVQITNKVKAAIFLLFITILFSFYGAVYQPLSVSVLALEDVQNAVKYLAVREDLQETFSTEIDKMQDLENDLEKDDESSREIEESIDSFKNKIADQLSSLRRDSLSALIEEKKVTPDIGINLDKLLNNQLTLEDSRELVLDLLSDESISKNQRNLIQKSYEDYSSDLQTESKDKLEEEIIDSLTPEISDKVEAIEDAVSSLDDALQKLKYPSQSSAQANGTQSSSEPSSQQGQDGESSDQLDMDQKSSSPGSGRGKNNSTTQDDFIPGDTSGLVAQLPEGQIIIEGNTGILRMQAEDELQLEKMTGIYDSTPFEEGIIRGYDLPETMKNLIKEYFLTIGGM